MNGRIYDPLVGRFLSADIVVQAPGNLQSYNRYSYVMNNPLKFTDPTGYFWDPDNGRWGLSQYVTFGKALAVDPVVESYRNGSAHMEGAMQSVVDGHYVEAGLHGLATLGSAVDVATSAIPGAGSMKNGVKNAVKEGGEQAGRLASRLTRHVDEGSGAVASSERRLGASDIDARPSANPSTAAPSRGNGGRGGGPEHAEVQQNITDTARGQQEVPVPGTRRIADNVDEQGRIHQVGDMRTRGGDYRPSARERGAIEDLREGVGPDVDIFYHDKRGRGPTLINPDQQPGWRPAPLRHRKPPWL